MSQSCFPTLPKQDFTCHCHIHRNHDHISLYIPSFLIGPGRLFVAKTPPPSPRNQTCLPGPVAGSRGEGKKRRFTSFLNDVLGRQSCISIWTFSKTQQTWEWFLSVKRINHGRQSAQFQMPLQIQATHTQNNNFITSLFFASRFTANWFIFEKMDLWNSLSAQVRIWFIASTYPHEPHATLLFYWLDVRKLYVMFLPLKWCLFSHQWVNFFSPTGWLLGRSFSDKMFHQGPCQFWSARFQVFRIPRRALPRWRETMVSLGNILLSQLQEVLHPETNVKISRWFDSWPNLIP